eukprot:6213179-Pleurochrysis_carterae.AAC.1
MIPLMKSKYLTTATQGQVRSYTVVRPCLYGPRTPELACTFKGGRGAGTGAGLDAPMGWLWVVAQSGCVGHARYGILELEERSASAPQRAASGSNRVLATRAKRLDSDMDETALIALGVIAQNEDCKIPRPYHYTEHSDNYPQVGHRQAFSAVSADGGICRPVGLTQYGRENRKSVVTPEAAPSKIGAPASGVVNT